MCVCLGKCEGVYRFRQQRVYTASVGYEHRLVGRVLAGCVCLLSVGVCVVSLGLCLCVCSVCEG